MVKRKKPLAITLVQKPGKKVALKFDFKKLRREKITIGEFKKRIGTKKKRRKK